MAEMKNTATEIISAMQEANNKEPTGYDTTAEVVRVEGSTAWVHIPGGVDETPVALTIGAQIGDTVQVRVSGGSAWLTGNLTDPPTSDKTANEALKAAAGAAKTVERGLVSDTLYYLASDQDSGVTVDTPGWTEQPQEITEALPYLWIYHLYTYVDGRTETTEPCIVGVYGPQGEQGEQGEQGDPGDPGAPGVSVTSVTPRYYLSTSSSSTIGGSWSDSLPTYVSGRYYWTRDKITYSNGTTGYSTATYSPGLTESVQLSYNTAQHFWTQTTGTTSVPTGAYVTEQTESAYKSSPTGGATLIRSTGLDVRVGTATYAKFDGNGTHIYDGNGTAAANTVAEFTGSGATIGKSGEAQVNIDYRSMTMKDQNTNKFFEVKDLRDTSGEFSYTETFTGDGTTRVFRLTYTASNTTYTVSPTPTTKNTTYFSYSTAPADGTTISVTYSTSAAGTKPISLEFGTNNNMGKPYGVALGHDLIVPKPGAVVMGQFNKGDSSNVFEIGAGTSSNNRKNLFEVNNYGDVSAGSLTASGVIQCYGGIYSLNSYLGIESAGGISAAGAITAGGLPSGLLVEEVSIVDNLTVASGSYSDGTASVAKTGYTPIGIVGFRCVNASSSGAGGAQGVIQYAYLSGTNNATANYRVRNVASGSMKVRIYFNVLYALA